MSGGPVDDPGKDSGRQALAGMLILFLAASVLFTANIGGYELWSVDETRHGQAAREMLEGREGAVPTLNGRPAPDMPPIPVWSIAVVSVLPGDVTEWSARLPSALAAIAVLLLSYLLALELFGRRTAIWSVIVLATSVGFWWQARSADAGTFFVAATTAMFYGFWRWDAGRRNGWLVVAYGALAAALLAIGPLALVYPAVFLAVFYRSEPGSRRQSRWLLGGCCAVALALCWHGAAHVLAASPDEGPWWTALLAGLQENTLGRWVLGSGTPAPPWHYVLTLPVAWFPWILFLPWILAHAWQERHANRMMSFLLCWIVPTFVVLSLIRDKQLAYTMPLYPALAVMAARGIVFFDQRATAQWRSRVAYVWGFLAAVAGGLAAVLAWVPVTLGGQTLAVDRPWLVTTMAAAIFALGAYALIRGRRRQAKLIHRVVAGQTALFLFMFALAVLPEINPWRSVRDLTAPVRMLAEGGVRMTVYSAGGVDPGLVFYSRHSHVPVLPRMVTVEEAGETVLDGASDAALADFVAAFAIDAPVFLFVAGADWSRIAPIARGLPTYHILRQEVTAFREMLLVANPAGEALYRQRKGGLGVLSRQRSIPSSSSGLMPNT